MMNECPGYEPCAGFIDGYCNVYDIHVGHGDECPAEDEYEAEERLQKQGGFINDHN